MVGLDVVRQAQQVRMLIGLSGQYAAVDENLTGHENLTMFGRWYRLSGAEARRRSADLLDQFALNDAADRLVKTYSGACGAGWIRQEHWSACRRLAIPGPADHGTGSAQPGGMWEIIRDRVRDGTSVLLDDPVPRGGRRVGAHHRRRRCRPHHRSRDGGRAQSPRGRRTHRTRRARSRGPWPAAQLLAPVDCRRDVTLDEHTRRMSLPARSGAQRLIEVIRELDEASIAIDDIGLHRADPGRRLSSLTGRRTASSLAGKDEAIGGRAR